MPRNYIYVLVSAFFVFLGGVVRAEPVEKRPNIFVFMADDQYKSSIGAYGAEPSHTPNIDRLAKEGMRFKHCFTPSAICTPNRAVFLTGMMPLKNGSHANHSGFYDGIESMPVYLKKLGYRVCLLNKEGIKRPNDLHEWELWIQETDEFVPGATDMESKRHKKTDFEKLEAFMAADDPRPFCIIHASRQPHTPYLSKLPNGLEGYDASNHYMDSEFGKDLELIDRLGLRDSTVVIYTNDNEANIPRSKYTLYETGTDVAFIVRWPGVVEPGTTSDAGINFIDVLPTFAEIAGGKPNPEWDGKSMVELWKGDKTPFREEQYYYYTGVVLGSRRVETPFPIRAVRTGEFKYILNLHHEIEHPMVEGMNVPEEELYDIVNDPTEQKNLAADPKFSDELEAMRNKLKAWRESIGDGGIQAELDILKRLPARPRDGYRTGPADDD